MFAALRSSFYARFVCVGASLLVGCSNTANGSVDAGRPVKDAAVGGGVSGADASDAPDGGTPSGHDGGVRDAAPTPHDAATPSDGSSARDAGSVMPSAEVVPMVNAAQPAVARGSSYRGFTERFNRYYTDATWHPSTTLYVSPSGAGDGHSMGSPSSVQTALDAAAPGTRIYFLSGTYNGCFELQSDRSGTYDAPIVLEGQRSTSGALSVRINCCATGRQTCINLEAASYVAVDGFELVGGLYGVRAVGADYAATQHQRGVAVLDCDGHGQMRDPFFTGASDWYVIERSLGHDSGSGDGHGIYLSNGSDWNIVRGNELWNDYSADFQINADPQSTCTDVGIDVASADCDALAGSPGDGGRGASDFMLVEGNFFHDGLAQGANFTSARHSIVRNNIFAKYAKHGVSFWQETTNPKLGASDNQVLHNLFVATVANRQMLQFVVDSDRNEVDNNVFVGVGAGMLAMEVDTSVSANAYHHNQYINAALNGRSPGADEQVSATLDMSWFTAFPSAASRDPNAWSPAASAPFLDQGALLPNATLDRASKPRAAPTDLGPFER